MTKSDKRRISELATGYFAQLRKKKRTLKNPELQRAAKQVAKQAMHHFRTDGWPLSWSMLLDDVFYTAYGEQLEWYLISALPKNFKGGLDFTENGAVLSCANVKPKRKRGRGAK